VRWLAPRWRLQSLSINDLVDIPMEDSFRAWPEIGTTSKPRFDSWTPRIL